MSRAQGQQAGGSAVTESPTVEATPIPLDRVMLAMDVVDTLRHQRELVERELDDDRRQHEFVERVQAIYESQGIEVSEEVVAEGVRALREDRFVYDPPERSFSVRLAELYVERGKWGKRAAAVLLVLLVAWAAWAVPVHFHRQGLIEKYEQNVARLRAETRRLVDRGSQMGAAIERAQVDDATAAESRLLIDAEGALADGLGQADAIAIALAALPAPEAYIDERPRWDTAVDSYGDAIGSAAETFVTARGLLESVAELRRLQQALATARERRAGAELSTTERAAVTARMAAAEAALATGDASAAEAALFAVDAVIAGALEARQQQADIRARFASLSSALTGVDVVAEAASEMRSLRSATEAAMAAGDWQRAGKLVGDLGRLVDLLDQSYELRIVSRPGDRSGVWRHPNRDRSRRNYYIIVEAIDADGRALRLDITHEEDQKTRRVRRFGVRVPKSVYEGVKADKLDNGLIDNVRFGSKRRGAREPSYEFPVAGGHITRW